MKRKVTKEELQAEMKSVKKLNDDYLVKDPSQIRYQWVQKELERFAALVDDHYPLTPEERKTCNFGLFAVRELEGCEDDLAEKLMILNDKIDLAK